MRFLAEPNRSSFKMRFCPVFWSDRCTDWFPCGFLRFVPWIIFTVQKIVKIRESRPRVYVKHLPWGSHNTALMQILCITLYSATPTSCTLNVFWFFVDVCGWFFVHFRDCLLVRCPEDPLFLVFVYRILWRSYSGHSWVLKPTRLLELSHQLLRTSTKWIDFYLCGLLLKRCRVRNVMLRKYIACNFFMHFLNGCFPMV